MIFKKDDLLALLEEDYDPDIWTIISDKVTGNSRWTINHKMIFSFEGKFYKTTYRVGATEQQDTSPYEYDGDEIECPEVFAIQKTITVYE